MMRGYRLLLLSIVVCGFVMGASATLAVYLIARENDRDLRHVQSVEAWARYDGQIAACQRGNLLRINLNAYAHLVVPLPIVDCVASTTHPTIPRP